MGVPGCPEFAACTASMDKVRIVLIVNSSIGCPVRARSMGVSTVMSLPHPAASVEGEPALLPADEAAVDEQVDTRAETRGVAEEEHGGTDEFVHCRHAPAARRCTAGAFLETLEAVSAERKHACYGECFV